MEEREFKFKETYVRPLERLFEKALKKGGLDDAEKTLDKIAYYDGDSQNIKKYNVLIEGYRGLVQAYKSKVTRLKEK